MVYIPVNQSSMTTTQQIIAEIGLEKYNENREKGLAFLRLYTQYKIDKKAYDELVAENNKLPPPPSTEEENSQESSSETSSGSTGQKYRQVLPPPPTKPIRPEGI